MSVDLENSIFRIIRIRSNGSVMDELTVYVYPCFFLLLQQ